MKKRNTTKIINQGLSSEERAFVKLYSVRELTCFKTRNEEDLKSTIAECTAIINAAEEEMRQHPDYIKAKALLAPLEKTFRDTRKYQDCTRDLASYLLKTDKGSKAGTIQR
jgi:hypothetical protein